MTANLSLTKAGHRVLGEIEVDLRNFGRQCSLTMTDSEVAMAVERNFGERLSVEVAQPHGLWLGECLALALVVVRGEMRVAAGKSSAHR